MNLKSITAILLASVPWAQRAGAQQSSFKAPPPAFADPERLCCGDYRVR
jgi:hypothetical protein